MKKSENKHDSVFYVRNQGGRRDRSKPTDEQKQPIFYWPQEPQSDKKQQKHPVAVDNGYPRTHLMSDRHRLGETKKPDLRHTQQLKKLPRFSSYRMEFLKL